MLSFSKPDQEERHPVDLNSVLDEILLLHEKQLKENGERVNSLAGNQTIHTMIFVFDSTTPWMNRFKKFLKLFLDPY